MSQSPAVAATNPLATPQREKAGSTTSSKFEYQYHWALCRAISAHENHTDYVVFVELHEDVVFATTTDEATARFEFNQIKSVSEKPWKHKRIVQRRKASSKLKNSILGKMLSGVKDKSFFPKLNSIDLVATCGFDLALLSEGMSLDVISVGDLHPDCLAEIQTAIDTELGNFPIPKTLRFVTPSLPPSGFQDATIGRISNLIDKTSPEAKYNPSNIYRVLIDELRRKGAITFDFPDWKELIKSKGMTQDDVEKIITTYTENKGVDVYLNEFEVIAKELTLPYVKRTSIIRSMRRHFNAIRLERKLSSIDNHKHVQLVVDSCFSIVESQGLSAFIDATRTKVNSEFPSIFLNEDDTDAAIFYELISRSI